MYQTIPKFLKQTGYKNPEDSMNTVFQEAFDDPRHVFMWLGEHPEKLGYFNDFMALRRAPEQSWFDIYPVEERTKDWDAEKPVFVDVGGSVGHQCAHFKRYFPNVRGRVILQDMQHSIDNALPTPGVENMTHDFFQPQPIKGMKHKRSIYI